MSRANVAIGHTGPGGGHWEPALTLREAGKVGMSKDDYVYAAEFARLTVDEHRQLGTQLRDQWEPTPNLNDLLAAPYIARGDLELKGRLASEADPQLDQSQDLLESVKERLDELDKDTHPIASPEAGGNYSVPEAVSMVKQHDATIDAAEAAGLRHHRRTSRLLRGIALAAPWVESIGFLTFITYCLNVPIFQPWVDWLGWSFGLTAVVVIIVGQTWLVRHAGSSHNHAREARANGHRQQAESARDQRDRYLWVAAVTAVVVTGGMIWRALSSLAGADFVTIALMILVATISGLLLPALTYLGVAFDGSKVSRERDSLARDLDEDLHRCHDIITASQRELADVAAIRDTLNTKTFPDICDGTQEAVDEVYDSYGRVRVLIGGLSAAPPATTTRTIGVGGPNGVTGHIGTSIAGVRNVNLAPLIDRGLRLTSLEQQNADLLTRINALSPHPWGSPRT